MNLFAVILLILAVALVFLYFTNHKVRYNLKFGTCLAIIMTTGVLVIPIAIFRPRNVANIGVIAAFWSFLFKMFGLKFDVRNQKYIESDKPYILVSNHQSSLDIIGMMNIIPSRCTALAKKELLFFGPFGPAAWLCGLVFIDRLNHEKARGTLEKTAKHMHDENIKLWVFPEGTRNRDGNMLPFKKGAFNLAVQAQVPVVPVVFSCYRHFHNKQKKHFNTGDVIVTCLPPVSTKGLTAEDVSKLTDDVRNDMVSVYKSSTIEVEEYARKIGNTAILNMTD